MYKSLFTYNFPSMLELCNMIALWNEHMGQVFHSVTPCPPPPIIPLPPNHVFTPTVFPCQLSVNFSFLPKVVLNGPTSSLSLLTCDVYLVPGSSPPAQPLSLSHSVGPLSPYLQP